MVNNKLAGDDGEQEVVDFVPCPNCGKSLMKLPPSYPLVDVQCTGCIFRAQVKTNRSKPKAVIFGAGWDVMEKVLKSGYLVPPLIANFKWVENGEDRQEIRFYPFVPKNTLKMRKLSETARRANYKMFNYTSLDKLPYLIVNRRLSK
jgi:hypothetical protein